MKCCFTHVNIYRQYTPKTFVHNSHFVVFVCCFIPRQFQYSDVIMGAMPSQITPHKGSLTRTIFPFDDVIMLSLSFKNISQALIQPYGCPYQWSIPDWYGKIGHTNSSKTHAITAAKRKHSKTVWIFLSVYFVNRAKYQSVVQFCGIELLRKIWKTPRKTEMIPSKQAPFGTEARLFRKNRFNTKGDDVSNVRIIHIIECGWDARFFTLQGGQ